MKKITLLFAILLLASTVFAQRGAGIKIVDENGRSREVELYDGSYALVIGASDYKKGWFRLPEVKEDVTEVSKILTKHGFTVETVVDPTSSNLLPLIRGFVDKYGLVENNRLLIYFSGHGYTEKGNDGRKFGYIVPIDAPDPTKNLIEFQQKAAIMDEIETVARRIRSKHALFVFDSCFSGSLISGSKSLTPSYINYWTAQPVRQFITAGSENEVVPAVSIFRQMFVKALEGDADRNNDKYITGTELAVYLQEKVIYYSDEKQTPQYGKIRDPKLDRGDFVFTIPVPSESKNSTSSNRAKASAFANQALIEIMRANLPEAESLVNQAINLDNSLALAYGVRGWFYYHKNNLSLSKNDLEKAIRLDSSNSLFYARLAVNYKNSNNDLAKRYADEALQKLQNPTSEIDYYAKGLSYYVIGNIDDSIREYSKSIEQNDKFAVAYNNRGVLYFETKKYENSIQDYSNAIKNNPKYISAYYNLATVFRFKKDYDSAIQNYSKVIELDPKNALAFCNRGVSYANKQEYKLAISDYTQAIGLDSQYFYLYLNRAIAYERIGEMEKAAADRQRYEELGGK